MDMIGTAQGVMEQIVSYWEYKAIFGLLVSIVGFLFGFDIIVPLTALLTLLTFDTALGVIRAYYCREEITPRRFFAAPKKLLIFMVLIASAHMFEVIVPSSSFFSTAMIAYLGANEFISIMRNAGRLGYSTPQKLLNMAIHLRDDLGENKDSKI